MGVTSQHKMPEIQATQYPQSRMREEIPEFDTRRILTEPEKVSAGFDEVVAGLERSDSFLQRRCAINREIERQLVVKTIR